MASVNNGSQLSASVAVCKESVNSVNIRALPTHLAALGQSESSSPQDDESPGHLLLHDLPVQQGR